MSQFTQLGISGKPENKSEKKTQITEGAKQPVEKQAVAVFAGALIFTGLVGGLLLETSGCSRTQSKSDIQAPQVQVASQSIPAPAVAQPSTVASTQAPAVKKVVKPRKPTTVLYSDSVSGVSFQYPKKYALKTLNDAKPEPAKQDATKQGSTKQDAALPPFDMNFVQAGGVELASVSLPKSFYPGTDLASASFKVSINKSLTAEQCGQFTLLQLASTDDLAVQPTRMKLAGMDLVEMEAISGSDAQQSDAKYYHRFENGTCYEFALGLEMQSGTADDEVVPVDRDSVFRRLERILATVKITPVPASATDEAAATVRPAPPVANAAPSAPSSSQDVAVK